MSHMLKMSDQWFVKGLGTADQNDYFCEEYHISKRHKVKDFQRFKQDYRVIMSQHSVFKGPKI